MRRVRRVWSREWAVIPGRSGTVVIGRLELERGALVADGIGAMIGLEIRSTSWNLSSEFGRGQC